MLDKKILEKINIEFDSVTGESLMNINLLANPATEIKVVGSNMTEIKTRRGDIVLFSYSTPVAAVVDNEYIRTSKKWSATTTRHINKWLQGVEAREVEQETLDSLV